MILNAAGVVDVVLLNLSYALVHKKGVKGLAEPRIPQLSEFSPGTEFMVKEFDVPLARIPKDGRSIWVNWYGGKPHPYDVRMLKGDNNWPAESFEAWVALIEASISQ